MTLDLTENIDITKEDIMAAKLKAYYKENGELVELDDAFYITGYSANDSTAYSAVQVRMEGSFKVSTLDPWTGWIRSNDDQERRHARLANQVYYELTTTKNVDFPLIYNGIQLHDAKRNPLSFDDDLDITAKFSYWDDKNECPVVQKEFENKYSGMFAYVQPPTPIVEGRNNENW